MFEAATWWALSGRAAEGGRGPCVPQVIGSPGAASSKTSNAPPRASVVVPVAIGLIFVLLFTTFGSIRQALMVW
jgi:hypothetical protein